MGHSQDILAAQRALVEDDDLRDELGLDDTDDEPPGAALERHRGPRGRLTHPDDDQVYACPSCDDSNPRLRLGENITAVPSAPCYCGTCGTGFGPAALVVREPGARGPAPGTGGRPPAAAPDDEEFVLIARGATSTSTVTAHLPDPVDPTRPKCHAHRQGDRDYRRLQASRAPDRAERCGQCDPSVAAEHEHPDEELHAKIRGKADLLSDGGEPR